MVFIKDASEERGYKGGNYIVLEKGSLVVSVIHKSCLQLLGGSPTQGSEHGIMSQTTQIQIQVLHYQLCDPGQVTQLSVAEPPYPFFFLVQYTDLTILYITQYSPQS